MHNFGSSEAVGAGGGDGAKPVEWRIRRAVPADAGLIARHRARMFEDMGRVSGEDVEELRIQSESRVREMLGRGEYVGFLAASPDDLASPAAGAGVQLRQTSPFPRTLPDGRVEIAEGRQALVINVYTEPEARGQGLARLLMQAVIAWARAERIESVVLHASEQGRPLYEKLGFEATNEMRLLQDW